MLLCEDRIALCVVLQVLGVLTNIYQNLYYKQIMAKAQDFCSGKSDDYCHWKHQWKHCEVCMGC